MFEYSFGFFLARLFKKNFKKTKLIGYQHGIFSDNIMWLDIIKTDKRYLPNKILALNKFSLKKKEAYKYTSFLYNLILFNKYFIYSLLKINLLLSESISCGLRCSTIAIRIISE